VPLDLKRMCVGICVVLHLAGAADFPLYGKIFDSAIRILELQEQRLLKSNRFGQGCVGGRLQQLLEHPRG